MIWDLTLHILLLSTRHMTVLGGLGVLAGDILGPYEIYRR